MNPTDNELAILDAIVRSEYHDGCNPINNPVWWHSICPAGLAGRVISGTMSSLVRKGWVITETYSREDGRVVSITPAGFAAWSAGEKR